MKRLLSLFIMMLLATVVFAQEATPEVTPEITVSPDTCPTLVAAAEEFTERNCSNLGRNEICIGYNAVIAVTSNNNLNDAGDQVPASELQSARMSPMDLANELWGLLVMQIDANIDGGDDLDSIQVVLYGDAELENTSHFVQAIALVDVDIYEKPRTDSRIVDQFVEGDNIVVNSQLDDGSWLGVRIVDETGENQLAWVQTELVEVTSPLDDVPVLTSDEAEEAQGIPPSQAPMQALIFRSGQDDALCEEAPNSGIVIQTPEGGAEITISINEVTITMQGTSVFGTDTNGDTLILVADGGVNTRDCNAAAGEVLELREASCNVRGATDEELANVGNAPLGILDDPVVLPTSNTDNIPIAGSWVFILDTPLPLICSDGVTVDFIDSGVPASIEPQIDSFWSFAKSFRKSKKTG